MPAKAIYLASGGFLLSLATRAAQYGLNAILPPKKPSFLSALYRLDGGIKKPLPYLPYLLPYVLGR